MRKYLLLLLVCSFVIILACRNENQPTMDYGYLAGRIGIGPICPVETNPPDPNCQPTEETYAAWPITVWTYDKHTKVASIIPQSDGAYVVDLAPGAYVVALDRSSGVGGSNLPQTVSITKGETTSLDIEIDTGIR